MSDIRLSQEESFFIHILKYSLTHNTAQICLSGRNHIITNHFPQSKGFSNSQWESVVKLAKMHSMLPLISDSLTAFPNIPEYLKDETIQWSRSVFVNNYRFIYTSAEITSILTRNNITSIILKSCDRAIHYPVPELRESEAIDVFIPNKDEFDLSISILKKHKYIVINGQLAQHYVKMASPEGISLELHYILEESFNNKQINIFIENIKHAVKNNIEYKEYMGYTFSTLTPVYNAYYIIINMLHQYQCSKLELRLLCDLVVIFNEFSSEKDQQKLYELLKRTKLLGFIQIIVGVCIKYLGLRNDYMIFLTDNIENLPYEAFIKNILEEKELNKSSKKGSFLLPHSSHIIKSLIMYIRNNYK